MFPPSLASEVEFHSIDLFFLCPNLTDVSFVGDKENLNAKILEIDTAI